jgi:hypothetical protein
MCRSTRILSGCCGITSIPYRPGAGDVSSSACAARRGRTASGRPVAGHSVDVLPRVYAKCIKGQKGAAKRRIEDAMRAAGREQHSD